MARPSDGSPHLASEVPGHCHDNFLASVRAVAERQRDVLIEAGSGLLRCAAPASPSDFNGLFLTEAPADARAELARTSELVRKAGAARWRLVADARFADRLAPLADAIGLAGRRELPGMWLPASAATPPPLPHELRIREPRSRSEWAEFIATGILGFGGPRPAQPEIGFPFELTEQYRPFWGWCDGDPVATSVAFPRGEVTGIFFVTTRPEFRGRGFDTALTWRAARVAQDSGTPHIFLQASEMGEPVYRRMGFQEIARYVEWTSPEPTARAPPSPHGSGEDG